MAYKTVWLIDDDDLSNFVNRSLLKSRHFAQSIVVFITVNEALLHLDLAINEKEDFPDLIFLDMEMPGLNGWDFLGTFRLLPKEIKGKVKLYMLSSSIDTTDALKAKQYEDITAFIIKPLTAEGIESIKTTGASNS